MHIALEGRGMESANNDLAILSLIIVGFYFVGLYKMGLFAGLFLLVCTVLLFAFIWPFGVVVLIAIASYGLFPSFRPREQLKILQWCKSELSRNPLSGNGRLRQPQ
jgi:hypothetical protein